MVAQDKATAATTTTSTVANWLAMPQRNYCTELIHLGARHAAAAGAGNDDVPRSI